MVLSEKISQAPAEILLGAFFVLFNSAACAASAASFVVRGIKTAVKYFTPQSIRGAAAGTAYGARIAVFMR